MNNSDNTIEHDLKYCQTIANLTDPISTFSLPIKVSPAFLSFVSFSFDCFFFSSLDSLLKKIF